MEHTTPLSCPLGVWECSSLLPDQELRWPGESVVLRGPRPREYPRTLTEFYLQIEIETKQASCTTEISTCPFLIINLSFHKTWTIHRYHTRHSLALLPGHSKSTLPKMARKKKKKKKNRTPSDFVVCTCRTQWLTLFTYVGVSYPSTTNFLDQVTRCCGRLSYRMSSSICDL